LKWVFFVKSTVLFLGSGNSFIDRGRCALVFIESSLLRSPEPIGVAGKFPTALNVLFYFYFQPKLFE